MDMNGVIQMINAVGFPIAACVALFYLCNTTIKSNTEALQDVSKTLALILAKLDIHERGDHVDG